MEALESDYFEAVCLLVRHDQYSEKFGVEYLGLGPALCTAIRRYLSGPDYYQDLPRVALMKEVLDARDLRPPNG